jgi:preprotein translocase subunit SecF
LQTQIRTYNLGEPTVTQKGNDWSIQFAQPITEQTLQNKLSNDFSVEKFTPDGNGASVTLRTPPSSGQVLSELHGLGFTDARVQGTSGNAYNVRVKALQGNVTTSDVGPPQPSALDNVTNTLIAKFGHLTDANNKVTDRLISSDTVSSIVSQQIVKKAAIAVIAASVAILLYISWAFRAVKNPFRYGVTAIIALLHDVVVVVGLFSIFGKLFGTEVDTMFLTGLLTVIGFSVHDTIVVFDRIRENSQRGISREFDVVVNESLLQTLDRSLSTSLTVVFTLIALLLLGGVTIQSFVLVLLIGIISGTYSSIAIASQLLVEWEHHNPGPYIGRYLRRFGVRRRESRPVARPQANQPVV